MKPAKPVRCAIYTRVSSDQGLEHFNSLDAQYDASQGYIRSQAHAGWSLVRAKYDDGGFSGGNTDHPAMQRLLNDVSESTRCLSCSTGFARGRATCPFRVHTVLAYSTFFAPSESGCVQVFGRRPPQLVVRSSLPASENLHKKRRTQTEHNECYRGCADDACWVAVMAPACSSGNVK
jgi:Resolvase, N terminal domain